MKYAGLIYDDSPHYLDHLGPFCALLNVPLILCEPHLAELAKQYYPGLQVLEIPLLDLRLPLHTISCDTASILQAAFPNQTTELLWLPHGNSDKGQNSPFFEAIENDSIAFVYGQKMIDFMHEKGVFPKTFPVGNFRWRYFQKNEVFYLSKLNFCRRKKNILYAPTWDDSENNNSFWSAFPHIVNRIPDDWELLVKLHPNTIRKFEAEIEVWIGRYEKNNIKFLPDIPPIYPLLYHCDAYIGDMSSIGYDFLTFNRPMYFLNANQELPLHRCGTSVKPESFCISDRDPFSHAREELYRYTFADTSNVQIFDLIWNDLARGSPIHSKEGG